MASLIATHIPIEVVYTKQNTTEYTDAPQEKASQTFFAGTPVQLNAGFVQAWDGTTVSAGILGVSEEDAHNLASNGLGAPTAFGIVGFPGTGTTFGHVPNQPNAVNIPEGAPASLGYIDVAEANLDTIFTAMTDNNTGSATTPTQANVGTQYGMTVDANGYWYVDFAKTTVGTNTVVVMTGLHPIDGSAANARILFQFTKSAMQIVI
jgi:hypothetical protein